MDHLVRSPPRRVFSSFFSRSAYLPLVWGCLRAYLETQPDLIDAYVLEEPLFLPEHVADAIDRIEDPAVFAASCYLWNVRKQLRLCEQVKQRWPDAVTVVGGPHVPDDPTAFLAEHPYVDCAIHKEGEAPFAALLRALLADEPDLSGVPSLSWRGPDGTVVRNPLGAQLPRELAVPSPWLTGLMEPSLRTAVQAGYAPIALWETNRGCPYSCTFCDWGSSTMSKLRRYDEGRLHSEIDWFAAHDVHAVLCCDANFGILPRDLELARHLVDVHGSSGRPAKFVTSYAKNATDRVFEISRLFAHAGMSNGTILAMQSGSEDVLEQVKRSNMKAERYEQLAAMFRADGVEAYTEVILGLPHETPDSFARGLSRMLEMGIRDDIMIYECALLPNSELGTPASREKHQLDTVVRTYLPGDPEEIEVVVGHATMTRTDWVWMYLFGATVQALHNRGLTRHVATYLHRTGQLSYERFYRSVLDAAGAFGSFGAAVERARRLLQDYLDSADVPNEGKVASQPDMIGLLRELLPEKDSWLPYEWVWARTQQDLDGFYHDLRLHLVGAGVVLDRRLEDLFRYQRATVFGLGDEPGARAELLDHDWSAYLESEDAEPVEAMTVLRFEAPTARMR